MNQPALDDVLYQELRKIAGVCMQRERASHTLQATALVSEAFLRLQSDFPDLVQERDRFFAAAARSMRQILVDHARTKGAQKRGGDRDRVPLVEASTLLQAPDADVLDIDEALTELAELDARKARVVELRFFAGLTVDETAEILRLSPTTVRDDWYFARAWLRARLAR